MTKAELVDGLLDQMKKKTQAYESILSLSLEEREKAATGDLGSLEEIGSKKNTQISNLRGIDQELDRIRSELSIALGGVEITGETIRALSKNAADELSSLTFEARSLVNRILDSEKINQKLYREKRLQVKDELDWIRQSRKMNFAYNRADEDLLDGSKFIDRKK